MPAPGDAALVEELDGPGIEKFLEGRKAVAFPHIRHVGRVPVIQ
jgi:hypothetical protein